MEYRDFTYWLQGFFELSDAKSVTKEQLQVIRNHLNLTLKYNQTKAIETTQVKPEVSLKTFLKPGQRC